MSACTITSIYTETLTNMRTLDSMVTAPSADPHLSTPPVSVSLTTDDSVQLTMDVEREMLVLRMLGQDNYRISGDSDSMQELLLSFNADFIVSHKIDRN